jgi:DNA-binding MarR family transcriptional regulator
MPEKAKVTEEEWAIWRAFFAMHRRLDRALERDLQAESEISGADYDVLLSLFQSPDRRLRSGELAERIGWEKSRLSHHVARMEKRGLLERSGCDSDARGTWISISVTGSRAVLSAMRPRAAAVRRYFLDVLTPSELGDLQHISERVLGSLIQEPCDNVGPDQPQ